MNIRQALEERKRPLVLDGGFGTKIGRASCRERV